jgi:hypothetical protein
LAIRVLQRHGNGYARSPARRDVAERGVALSARYKRHPPRATELDPFKDYVIKRLNSGAGAAATERAADRAARVGLSRRLCVKPARFVTSGQIALPDRCNSHSQILATSVPGEPLLAVTVIYSPATANRPTPGTASIGRSGRIQ